MNKKVLLFKYIIKIYILFLYSIAEEKKIKKINLKEN